MTNDDFNYYRLTTETQIYLDEYGAQPNSDHMPQYCLRVPQDAMPDVGARPLLVHRCPWKDYELGLIEGGPRIKYDLICVTGDAVTKLAEYENIHVHPGELQRVYEDYERMLNERSCLACDLHGTKGCKYPPKWGSPVRINCPFFRHQLSIEEGEVTG